MININSWIYDYGKVYLFEKGEKNYCFGLTPLIDEVDLLHEIPFKKGRVKENGEI